MSGFNSTIITSVDLGLCILTKPLCINTYRQSKYILILNKEYTLSPNAYYHIYNTQMIKSHKSIINNVLPHSNCYECIPLYAYLEERATL